MLESLAGASGTVYPLYDDPRGPLREPEQHVGDERR
jgi:hypothetical protein